MRSSPRSFPEALAPFTATATYSPIPAEAQVLQGLVGAEAEGEVELFEAGYDGITFDIGSILDFELLCRYSHGGLSTFADWLRKRSTRWGHRPLAISQARTFSCACVAWATLRPRMFLLAIAIQPRRMVDSPSQELPTALPELTGVQQRLLAAPFGVEKLASPTPQVAPLGQERALGDEGSKESPAVTQADKDVPAISQALGMG